MSDERQEGTASQGEEFRGKTVEAAINAGLAALGASRDEVAVEIIRTGSRGVLGIGAEDAVVRLSLIARPAVSGAREPAPVAEPAATPPAIQEPSQPESPQPTPAAQPPARAPRGRPTPKAEPVRAAAPAVPTGPKEPPARADEDKSSAAVREGQVVLQDLLDRMNLRARVEILQQSDAEAGEGERVQVLNIVGDDLGVLIGRQNEVLTSLELITRLIVNQRVRIRSNFVVDVNGYRAKRAESLRRLALRMADQVVETGRTAVLEPMPPAERRIIHLALRDHPHVTTQSVGEGDRRKVTIIPKRE